MTSAALPDKPFRVLAVNTAATRLSLAVAEGPEGGDAARIFFAADIDEPRDQGDYLLHTIDRQLQDNGIAYSDLDLMAAVTGPGSFTGIRIGLAALHGFSLAAGVSLAGLTSFELIAALASVSTPHRLTVMESWRDELYFQLDDDAPFNVTPADCMTRLKDIQPTALTLLGDAATKMAVYLPAARINPLMPTAADMATLLIKRADLRRGAATPFYLRPPDVSFGKGNRQMATTVKA